VKKVGLKTTRIRSLGGEELIFTNTDLLGSRVKNYKRMQERRVVFHFGVLYQTAADKLREVKRLTRETIEATEHARFDRAHFQAFGDSSLVFEAVYYVDSNDYNIYMDVQEAINLRLFEAFEELGVDFAYPTRTLHLASGMDSLRSSLVEREASGEASTEEPGNGRDPDSSGEESREPASSNERGHRGE
jgi:small-conductance mechanosensitive channel